MRVRRRRGRRKAGPGWRLILKDNLLTLFVQQKEQAKGGTPALSKPRRGPALRVIRGMPLPANSLFDPPGPALDPLLRRACAARLTIS